MIENFNIRSKYTPKGDQTQAIDKICKNVRNNTEHQTLLGVTGSGKTFTIANAIHNLNRSSIILAPNKTLAAQIFTEMQYYFPNNEVQYFVSYYDFYQPEAYLPSSDTFIEKDASINEQIEQMRLAATKSILERKDVIIVSSVSAIYGLGDPSSYKEMRLTLEIGQHIKLQNILHQLTVLQYSRNDYNFTRGTFRARGDVIDIFPAESNNTAIRICLFGDEIESLSYFSPINQKNISTLASITIYPRNHFVTPKEKLQSAVITIRDELEKQLLIYEKNNLHLEAQRLKQRTEYDLEMMEHLGFCNGIENYSRHISLKQPGEPPATLLDYLPPDALIFIDESHITIPQLIAMHKGDRARKENLVKYGFRLPSALDNRPLSFSEFNKFKNPKIYISATPGKYEFETSKEITELIVRPTGLLDPQIEIRSSRDQIENLLSEIHIVIQQKERILVTTLTKKMSEDLAEYFNKNKIKARYLHSEINTIERLEIITEFRKGVFDVLIGVNLLREGLDMPEVSLIAILDADKAGFLRSYSALIQTIGRAARNINGRAILYAESITDAMQKAIDETNRRRQKQTEYNSKFNITPQTIKKDILESFFVKKQTNKLTKKSKDGNKETFLNKLEEEMNLAAEHLNFELAIQLRDKITDHQSIKGD
jgi:excinuclease ABC subunit B